MGFRLLLLTFAFVWVGWGSPQIASAAAKTKLSGKAIVIIEDDLANKKSKTLFLIDDKLSGRRKPLKFAQGREPDELLTGQEITVTGTVDSSGALQVDSMEVGAALTPTNIRKAAIIVINFKDAQSSMTVSQVTSTMYGASNSVADLYAKNSLGQLIFDSDANKDGRPDIFGPYTIDRTTAEGCIYSQAGGEGYQMAVADGMDPALYNHYTAILPASMGCGWAGLAYMGGAWAYVKHSNPIVLAHELGHNLGMHHASTDWGNDGTNDGEYSDTSCIMGNSPGLKFINGAKTYQMQFFSPFPQAMVDGKDGDTIRIAPLEDDPQIVTSIPTRIVRIPRANSTQMYFFSMRKPTSYVTAVSSSGIAIHKANASGSGHSYLIGYLSAGQTWTDPNTGVAVEATEFRDGSYATIKISTACTSAPPTLTIDPAAVPATGVGKININVKNNDSPACRSTEFQLAETLPAGALGSLSNPRLRVAPGATATTTLNVTTTNFVGPAELKISAADIDMSSPEHASVEATATMTEDSIAPTAFTLSGSSRRNSISLSWTASSDAGGIRHYEVYKSEAGGTPNMFTTTTTTSASYYGYAGDSFFVIAVDYAGNKTRSTTYTVGTKGGRR